MSVFAAYTPSNRFEFHLNQLSDDFYNKPFGMRHFLAHARPALPEDVVLALLDPDMVRCLLHRCFLTA